MFREAEMVGLIGRGMNPVSITRIPNAEVSRSRLTLAQFQAIYAKALERQPWLARSMELAMLTAQRREDIARMQRREGWAPVRDPRQNGDEIAHPYRGAHRCLGAVA